jgi:hypothetical protein
MATHDCSVSKLMEAVQQFGGKRGLQDDATVILLRSA